MLKNSRGLTIGLTALAFLSISVFFLLKAPASLADGTAPDASATAIVAAPAVAPPAPIAATPAPVQMPTAPAPAPDLLAAPPATKVDVDVAMKDRVLGKESAPVTITEYASLTCPHCAYFSIHIMPELKKRLLDTGKAKLIYRDFPLDKFALK